MTGQSRSPLTLLLLSFLVACDAGPTDTELGEPELRAFPTGSYWDEVLCDEDSPTLCYGHRAGTGPVWSRVYSADYLDDLVTAGWLVPSAYGWGESSCDAYGVPSSTPEYACYTMVGSPICFGGEGHWFAQVVPACQDDGYTSNWFATGSCITTISASGYDSKKGKAGYPNRARGWIGDDQLDIRPNCYVDSLDLVNVDENGRRRIAEVSCDAYGCDGRWDDSDLWTLVTPVDDFNDDLVEIISTPSEFSCHPDADVDICAIIDVQGHQGCFRYEGDYVVPVAPDCYVSGENWQWVGNGMVAWME